MAGRQNIPLAEIIAMTGHASVATVIGYHRAGAAAQSRAARLLQSDALFSAASRYAAGFGQKRTVNQKKEELVDSKFLVNASPNSNQNCSSESAYSLM